RRTRGYALGNAGECYARIGETDKAREMILEAEKFFKEQGEEYVVASMKMAWGIIYAKEGDWDNAKKSFEEGASTLELLGIRYDMTILLKEYGLILIQKGDSKQARDVLRRALFVADEINATSLKESIEKAMTDMEGKE
ncbi:MAG: hypothetical protein QCI38_05605, partial [Candidatus Thermoplasmatota archaeon]|nr:hypothetical protein [Candidatus Thermoplasmatota archaeon]